MGQISFEVQLDVKEYMVTRSKYTNLRKQDKEQQSVRLNTNLLLLSELAFIDVHLDRQHGLVEFHHSQTHSIVHGGFPIVRKPLFKQVGPKRNRITTEMGEQGRSIGAAKHLVNESQGELSVCVAGFYSALR